MLSEYYLNNTWILPGYYLELFRWFKIVGEIFRGREEIYNNASLAARSLLKTVDAHYTSTLGKR